MEDLQQNRFVCQITRRNPNFSHSELKQLPEATGVIVSVETIRGIPCTVEGS